MDTFMQEYRVGRVTAEDLQSWIVEWAAAPTGSALAKLDLVERLGMSHKQYAHWVATGEVKEE